MKEGREGRMEEERNKEKERKDEAKYSLDNELIVAFIVSTFLYIIIHTHTHTLFFVKFTL